MRIGNAEREQAVDMLRGWFVSGHLDETELEDRIGRALQAKTDTELQSVAADLPVPVGKTLETMFDPGKSYGIGVLCTIGGPVLFGSVLAWVVSTNPHGIHDGQGFMIAAAVVVGFITFVCGLITISDRQSAVKDRRYRR